jgi:16S rRNA G966 N2-methylase RsmD
MRLPRCAEWPPVVLGQDAREVVPNADLSDCVVYVDPPYRGTTPYQNDLTREEVVAMARRWSQAGAIVLVSEAEPVEGLGSEWEAVEITAGRKGQARTFGNTREWLTMNRTPAHRVATQAPLFARASA